jgi:hypothetical protein
MKINKKEKIKEKTLAFSKFLKENKLFLIFFLISTIFFIYQHNINLSWDFNTYILNGQYWFSDGTYFEPFRPPLMPFLLGLFSIFGWKISEFIFIFFASALFAYSSFRLSKSLKFNPLLFYAISLNPFLLFTGLINGTELLSLAFLELCIAFIIENKSSSGIFLGLSALSRYTGFALFPILFFQSKIKKIIKSIIFFTILISPWFIYNYYKFGNFFTSIADQYANNILYRGYLYQPIDFSILLEVQNILLPFFIIGLMIVFYKIFKQIKNSKNFNLKSFFSSILKLKTDIIMIFLIIYSIYSFIKLPIKNPRYLFNILLPTFYFSYIGLSFLIKKIKNNKKSFILASITVFIAGLLILSIQFPEKEYEPSEKYYPAINKIKELNLSNCLIISNSWVMLNYLGLHSEPIMRFELLEKDLLQGKKAIIFKEKSDIDFNQKEHLIEEKYIIYDSKNFMILSSEKCKIPRKFEESYLEQLDKVFFEMHNYNINYNPCFILFMNNSLAEKTCNLINFKGFKKDLNREYQ